MKVFGTEAPASFKPLTAGELPPLRRQSPAER